MGGCLESRPKKQDSINLNGTPNKQNIDEENNQNDNKQTSICEIENQQKQEPSISFDDDNSDSIMNVFDEEISLRRQQFCKNKAIPKIQNKNIIRNNSPKRESKLNLRDLKKFSQCIEGFKLSKNIIQNNSPKRESKLNLKDLRKFSSQKSIEEFKLSQNIIQNNSPKRKSKSQKCIEGFKLSKNMQYHYQYHKINRIRMNNRINHNDDIQKQQQENLQNDQMILQMTMEPFNKEEEDNQYSRKNSESYCSRLSDIDTICFSCQTKVSHNIFQLECLHHFHNNCLQELIIQQINNKQLEIHCRCNKVIRTQLLAIVLKQQDVSGKSNSNQDIMDIYFKNQYDFLTQNLY